MSETDAEPSTSPVETGGGETDGIGTDGIGTDDDADPRERLFDLDDLRPPRRTSKWDRPPAPRDWRWYVGTVGKVLIALGMLLFGFVAYQLWGTGIETARAQRALEKEFEELLADAPVPPEVATPEGGGTSQEGGTSDQGGSSDGGAASDEEGTSDGGGPTGDPDGTTDDPVRERSTEPVPRELQVLPEVENGDALARLEIPAIGVDDIVVAGVEPADLKKGPGHYPDTPLPGQLGNAAIAGHRTTYGQPFHDVDDLEVGDEIVVTTLSGTFTYLVTGQQIVSPSASEVVATTDPSRATLTLTSCHPKWSARERIVISSELDPGRSAPVGETVVGYGREPVDDDALPDGGIPEGNDDTAGSPDGTTPDDAANDETGEATDAANDRVVSDEVADAFSNGWFSDPGAFPHVAGWGFLLTAISVGAWLLSRRFRHDWVGALVGIAPFAVALYFFFQNVNRLLPPNL